MNCEEKFEVSSRSDPEIIGIDCRYSTLSETGTERMDMSGE